MVGTPHFPHFLTHTYSLALHTPDTMDTHTVTPLVTIYVHTHTRNTHHHKDEMRALMEVASFITASPLIPCYWVVELVWITPQVGGDWYHDFGHSSCTNKNFGLIL